MDEVKFKQDFEAEFGELTSKKLWLLVRLSKNVRLRCRNNTAFNNFFSRVFPYAKFKQVMKRGFDGKEYPGLSIEVKGETFGEELPED